MKRVNQQGFGPFFILATLVVIVGIGASAFFVFGFGAEKDQHTSGSSSQNSGQRAPAADKAAEEDQLILQNVGLRTLSPYDSTKGMSGDVYISQDALREYDSMGMKGFYAFGDVLGGKIGKPRLNPNFEFSSLKSEVEVVSAIDGIVAFVKEQTETKDFEVFLQPKEGSAWTVGYDHIANLKVTKGTEIKAGTVIGNPAVQGNGLARFELQINHDKNGSTVHHCPTTLLAAGVKDQVESELIAMQAAWEAFSGKELYDQVAQKPAGCIKETMTVAEAEGL